MAGYFDSLPDFTPIGLAGNIYSSISGNQSPIDSLWNTVRGDPNSVKGAYDAAMGQSKDAGAQQKEFLMGQQQKALQFYAPLQQMFNNTYGTGQGAGIQGPQVPQGPFGQTFGGAR